MADAVRGVWPNADALVEAFVQTDLNTAIPWLGPKPRSCWPLGHFWWGSPE